MRSPKKTAKKSKPDVFDKEIAKRDRKSTFGPISVQARVIDCTRLVTIGVDHSLWTPPAIMPEVNGAIVKVLPPVNIEDAAIAIVKDLLLKNGAVTVRVMPRARGGETVVHEVGSVERPHQSIRSVVEAMVGETRSSAPLELKKVVETVMSKVGL